MQRLFGITARLGFSSRRRTSWLKRFGAAPANSPVTDRRSTILGLAAATARVNSTTTITFPPNLINYLTEAGVDESLHEDVLQSIASVYGGRNDLKLVHLESFGATGLQALADSIREENLRNKGGERIRPRRSVTFRIPHHQTDFCLDWRLGDSLVDLARHDPGVELLGEYIEAACGGNASCSTCHIYLDQATKDMLDPPSEAELDMLDLAFEARETSRLGCQVRLTEEILKAEHEIEVTIPEGVHNMWN